nr:uncharacterized protein LOC104652285 [Saimiri boliviensis boliviensis]
MTVGTSPGEKSVPTMNQTAIARATNKQHKPPPEPSSSLAPRNSRARPRCPCRLSRGKRSCRAFPASHIASIRCNQHFLKAFSVLRRGVVLQGHPVKEPGSLKSREETLPEGTKYPADNSRVLQRAWPRRYPRSRPGSFGPSPHTPWAPHQPRDLSLEVQAAAPRKSRVARFFRGCAYRAGLSRKEGKGRRFSESKYVETQNGMVTLLPEHGKEGNTRAGVARTLSPCSPPSP